MRIIGFDLWHLVLPVTTQRDHGIGTVAGNCEVIILRLTAEDGTQGWGEAAPWAPFTGSPEASRAALDRYIRPVVLGRNPSERVAIMADANRVVAHATEAKAALDSALLDLAGRLAGLPVYALLGGKCRDRIPLSVSLANPDWHAEQALLEQIHGDGIRIVKLKAGVQGPEFDLMRIRDLQRDFPDMAIRVDYNQGLSTETAEAEVRAVADLNPDFIEQPVAAHNWSLMARIRDSIHVPLLADESVFGPEDMVRAVRDGIADGISVKIMKAGGLFRAQTVARMAHAAGMTAYGGDMFETGLGHLAGTHLIAATPEISLGCEFYQAGYYLQDDILSTPFPVKNGHVIVPTGPGLGSLPNLDILDRYATWKDH